MKVFLLLIRMGTVQSGVELIGRLAQESFRYEIRHTAFQVVHRTKRVPSPDEACVTALRRKVEGEVRIALGGASDLAEDVGREERVIHSIEQERVDSDSVQIPDGAGACVIIYCVIESMNRGGDYIVEFTQARYGGNTTPIR